jgi:HEAT repeat protein
MPDTSQAKQLALPEDSSMTRNIVVVCCLLAGAGTVAAQAPTPPLVTELTDLVRDTRGTPLWSRVRAAETLGKMGPDARGAVAGLAEFLVDPLRADPLVLDEAVVQALGRIGTPARRAIPAMMRVASKSFDLERQVVASTDAILAAGADAGEVPALIKALHDKDPVSRMRAARVLGSLGPIARDSIPGLTETLRDPDIDVRHQALQALRRVRPSAKPAEAEAGVFILDLRDPDPAVRLAAVKNLRAMGPAAAGAAQVLLDAAQDPDPDVRRLANEVTNQLPPPH